MEGETNQPMGYLIETNLRLSYARCTTGVWFTCTIENDRIKFLLFGVGMGGGGICEYYAAVNVSRCVSTFTGLSDH